MDSFMQGSLLLRQDLQKYTINYKTAFMDSVHEHFAIDKNAYQ